jgi:Ca2+-binding EF-hand superfamily protein
MPGPVDKLRSACLQRGANGIHSIGRTFRVIDDNGSRSLDRQELNKGLQDFGLRMSRSEVDELFAALDKDHSGSISFDEFLQALRPPMSKARLDVIGQAFRKLDKTGDGQITVDDLRLAYDVTHYPKYRSGEKSRDQILKEFLDIFQTGGNMDDIVTKEEFVNYYSGVSASIDDDQYFVQMMKKAWKL